MRTLMIGTLALAAAAPAFATDAHYPRYEQDVYRSRMDVATVGLVISGLGVVGGAAGLVSDQEAIGDILSVQGTLFMAGGATVATYGALSARAYPLEKRVTLVPAVASLSLAGLSGVGLLAWAANGDPDLDDTLRYGTLGLGAAATGLAIVQMGANGAAWRDRQRATKVSMSLVPRGRGVALVGRF